MDYIVTKDGKKSLLEATHKNYIVPKGEEHLVHYTAERVLFDSIKGVRVSHPDLIKTEVKLFDSIVKRQLELEGKTINILHHPLGKYIEYTPVLGKEDIIAQKDAEIAERDAVIASLADKDDEIAALKAELAALKAKGEEKSTPAPKVAEKAPKEATKPTNKGGRPAKTEKK